jgi:hypothetical protein
MSVLVREKVASEGIGRQKYLYDVSPNVRKPVSVVLRLFD